jgi:hydroxyacylglutathione hydrolase
MLIERIWAANAYRNFHYLIACPETGEALAVDPLKWELCNETARRKGWQITQILNTHEHGDHTGGNAGLVRATHAKVLAHAGAASRIGGVDRGLKKGDVIRVGRTVELECLDTPGHTMAHICLLGHGDQPALFCGDTLFNAGAGNCHGGGHPEALYHTFEFTLDREPTNGDAQALLARARNDAPADAVVTTLAEEKQVNTFFRLQNPTVIGRLRETFPDIGERPDARTVFLKLRELRNTW